MLTALLIINNVKKFHKGKGNISNCEEQYLFSADIQVEKFLPAALLSGKGMPEPENKNIIFHSPPDFSARI